ncbi:MAG3090 family protein [Mycoplasmopsis agalactiae]|uniref:MAG3090 family protein n=1 Tax=Mycoplasmopsis agalactiae TaxID=2110 RepID=UPI002F94BF62
MKRVAIFYNAGTEFPWVLKHPKKEEIIGQFKSRKDAVFWYISFKLETLILLLNEKMNKLDKLHISKIQTTTINLLWYLNHQV